MYSQNRSAQYLFKITLSPSECYPEVPGSLLWRICKQSLQPAVLPSLRSKLFFITWAWFVEPFQTPNHSWAISHHSFPPLLDHFSIPPAFTVLISVQVPRLMHVALHPTTFVPIYRVDVTWARIFYRPTRGEKSKSACAEKIYSFFTIFSDHGIPH